MVVSEPDAETFDAYVQNYCDSYSEQLAERYLFVEELMPVTVETDFILQCETLVSENPNLNAWFDPIAQSDSITVAEVCTEQWTAFNALNSDEVESSTNDYVESSYMSSLTLNLEAYMREDYENCINKDVVDDPNEWATSFLDGHTTFLIWTEEARMTVAAEAAVQVDSDC